MVNLPLPESLDKECLKAAKTLRSFTMPESQSTIDSVIPPYIIDNARGLVILTVIKAGFLFSGRVGFGLVVAKLPNGDWSAPSAIGTASFGAGLQIGAELTDFVIVLNDQKAVDAFCYGGNVALGGNLSVAAGPVGRNAEAAAMATVAATYSYSKTKGLFAGISLEGTVFAERTDANEKLYGKRVKARDLLSGNVPAPPEAAALYDAIRRHEAAFKATPYSTPYSTPSTPYPASYSSYPSSSSSSSSPHHSGEHVHHDNLTYPAAPAAKTYQAAPPGYPPSPSPSPSPFSLPSSPSTPPPPLSSPLSPPLPEPLSPPLDHPPTNHPPSLSPPFNDHLPEIPSSSSSSSSPPVPPVPVPVLPPPPPSKHSSTKTYSLTATSSHLHHHPHTTTTTTVIYSPSPNPPFPPFSPFPAGLSPPPPLPLRKSSNHPQARALYDFAPLKEGDLSFKAGEVLWVTERTPSQQDWWRGALNGREGAFPANYVQII